MHFIKFGKALTALAFMLAAPPAYSAVTVGTLSGSVTSAEADNPFNLAVGDILSGRVIFSRALLSGIGSEFLDLETA